MRATAVVLLLAAACGGSPKTAVPAAPTEVVAIAGDAQATVKWKAPPAPDRPITGYTVTASPGTSTAVSIGLEATVTGLVNGTRYTFTVTAQNDEGEGARSAPSKQVTPLGRPGAPMSVTAKAGVGSALLTWKEPAETGGTPVLSYTVESTPGGLTVTTIARIDNQATVTGLVPGTAYRFTVTARNAVGDGPASLLSDEVTTARLPTAPGSVIAMAGDGKATVSWTAPVDDGGTPITGYQVFGAAGNLVASTTGPTQAIVMSLTNGQSAAFYVRAQNALGAGPPSPFSNSVTPAGLPAAPTQVMGTRGNQSAALSWVAPANTGGLPILEYVVTSNPPGFSAITGGATQATVTGLTNGNIYTFNVAARNALGFSPHSAPSNLVTPSTVPGAPTMVTAEHGDASAIVTWVAPVDSGGATVISYAVTAFPGGLTATTTATTTTVQGLTNGTSYTFSVRATNIAGVGAPSAPSNAVTPFTVPSPPDTVTAVRGNAQATVTWTQTKDDGGSPVTHYIVTALPSLAAVTVAASVTSTVIAGLTNGTPTTFTVTAVNAAGAGPASSPSASVTPATVPLAPTQVVATVIDATTVEVTWTVPGDGGDPIVQYLVTPSIGPVRTATVPHLTFASLTPGQSIAFTVRATNGVGTGPAASSNTVAPVGVPDAPTAVTAVVVGDGTVSVTWTPPAVTGGLPVTGYTIRAQPSGTQVFFVGPSPTTRELGPIANGVTHTFEVRAQNAAGDGPWSVPSNAVTPVARPGAPTGATATLQPNGTVTVAWVAPAAAVVDTYLVHDVSTGVVALVPGTSTQTTLTPGWAPSHAFTVAARNTGGTSLPSAASNAVVVPGPTCVGIPSYGPQMALAGFTNSHASADFNGDGKRDFVTTIAGSVSAQVTVNLGTGTGDFASFALAGPGPSGLLLVADFTKDGLADLVVTSAAKVAVFPSLGTGAFLPRLDLTVSSTPAGLAAGDFDEDGERDLVLTHAGSIGLHRGNGNGTFAAASVIGPSGWWIESGDFNGDGHLDLVHAVTVQGDWVQVRLGNGDGTFQLGQTLNTPFVRTLAVARVDGDAILDLVYTSNEKPVVAYGVGDGTFTQTAPLAMGGTTPIVTHLALGDVDGDGRVDLVATMLSNHVTVRRGLAAGGFGAPTSQLFGAYRWRTPWVDDFDGDGLGDLVLATDTNDGFEQVLHGNGDGTFQFSASTNSYATIAEPHVIASADFNGDGRGDLATVHLSQGRIGIALSNPNGTFGAPTYVPVGGQPWDLDSADFDADGNIDLVVVNRQSGTMQVLLGQGNGGFTATPAIPVGADPLTVAVGDVNLDGVPDVAVGRLNAGIAIVLHNGNLNFPLPMFVTSASTPTGLRIDDLTGDGKPDLVWANAGANTLGFATGTGTGTFLTATSVPTALYPRSPVTGDFNQDGHRDVAFANQDSASVGVMFGSASGFTPSVSYSVGSTPISLAATDLDGDGHLDLVTANSANGSLSLLEGSASGVFSPARRVLAGSMPYSVAAGDFNADGAADLAVANYSPSAVTVLLRLACF